MTHLNNYFFDSGNVSISLFYERNSISCIHTDDLLSRTTWHEHDV